MSYIYSTAAFVALQNQRRMLSQKNGHACHSYKQHKITRNDRMSGYKQMRRSGFTKRESSLHSFGKNSKYFKTLKVGETY